MRFVIGNSFFDLHRRDGSRRPSFASCVVILPCHLESVKPVIQIAAIGSFALPGAVAQKILT